MNDLKFSIIIPAYNNAEFLGEAIQSVLNQTYQNFEIMVVNDASPDNTPEVVSQFKDSRIKYIEHKKNLGLSAARNTGICASTGEWIALLDGDDFFHPKKLEIHEEYIKNHPDIGVTYNSRFELNHSAMTIRELWRPPLRVTLSDLVQGFPFGPSDMVVRRDWIFKVGLFDIKHIYVGEDLDINCKLALAGCTFANVDKALNYRRYHSGRKFKNLRSFVDDTIDPLNATFSDPHCPEDVLTHRNLSYAKHYLLWGIIAFIQGETDFGQELSLKAIELDPSLALGMPNQFLETIVTWSVMDESEDHEQMIKRIMDQLPNNLKPLTKEYEWAIAKGYLMKGIRAIMWSDEDKGYKYFKAAIKKGPKFSKDMQNWLVVQILNYKHELGDNATSQVLHRFSDYFVKVGLQNEYKQMMGSFFINQAFDDFRVGLNLNVLKETSQACLNNPEYFTNRGVLSIFFRSILGMLSLSRLR